MRILSRIASLLALQLVFLPAMGAAQKKLISPERDLFNATNRERLAHGLPALQWNDALAGAARKHASEMAHKDALSHQFPGEPSLPSRVKQMGAHFVWLSENVALGPNTSLIHAQLVKSPQHRANMLDTDMNVVGIGIVERNGRLFAVEDFSKAK
ncbi:MAG TPA: CAP domain-containing protein [Terriglobales bacterium]|nr:CAP domain-containing protein [Terriglobales bacterium]